MTTNFDFEAYIEMAYEVAKERKRAQRDFSEIDFFMGAAVVFRHLNAMDEMPAKWIFFPMAGRSILDDDDD